MQYHKMLGVAFLAAVAITSRGQQKAPEHSLGAPQLYAPPSYEQILGTVKSARIRAIFADLIPCESGGRPEAVNPADLDGTPSHGLLQFKPETLYGFGREAGLFSEMEAGEIYNVLYDPEIQVQVATYMIEKYGHARAFWEQQWPGCSRKYDYWTSPKYAIVEQQP